MTLNRIKPSVLALTVSVLLGATSCSSKSDTNVTIQYGTPLQFVLSGWGTIDYFEVSGPDRRYTCNRERLSMSARYWQIAPLQDVDVHTLAQAGPITYGKLPPGFRQVVPEEGQVPPILENEPGCPYWIRVAVRTGNGHSVSRFFAIRDGKVIEEKES